MQRPDDAGRAAPLVLELVSGTAILHGEEVGLPPREFRLLAALAKRVGEPVSSAALMEAVWAEDAAWTPPHNLIVLVSKLRRLIDGPTKFGKNIRNRRSRGYMLDLDPNQVIIIEAPTDEEAAERVVYLDQSETIAAPETPITEDVQPQEETVVAGPIERPHQEVALPSTPKEPRRVAGVAALVLALLAGSWGAGYVLSSRDASQSIADQPEDDAASKQELRAPSEGGGQPEKSRRGDRREQVRKRESKKRNQANGSVIAASGTSTGDNLSDPSGTHGSSEGSDSDQQPVAALPPAPTRYLYHLVNPETGDHFVTTDSSTASEQEARGYEGGAIARIYTYREENTKAITTNHGTGYIFIGSTPKTEPASRTIALWYSTNDAGDFFYTISESQAKQEGWAGSLIGYVRTL
jgi:DNA-binding winged helix-turn-helix (wHTH) protein